MARFGADHGRSKKPLTQRPQWESPPAKSLAAAWAETHHRVELLGACEGPGFLGQIPNWSLKWKIIERNGGFMCFYLIFHILTMVFIKSTRFRCLITKMDSHGSMYVLCWTVGYPHAKQTRNNLEQFQQPEIWRVTSSKTTICDETGSGSQGTKLQAVPIDFVGSTWSNPLSFHVIQFLLLGQGFPWCSSPSNSLQTANPRCQIQSASAVETPLDGPFCWICPWPNRWSSSP